MDSLFDEARKQLEKFVKESEKQQKKKQQSQNPSKHKVQDPEQTKMKGRVKKRPRSYMEITKQNKRQQIEFGTKTSSQHII